MLEFGFLLKYLTSLFVIVDPFAGVPLFIASTANNTREERKYIIRLCGIAVACILSVAAFAGQWILNLFGIGMPAFQTAGGIILFLLALSMLHAKRHDMRGNREEKQEAVEKDNIAVFPLAIPFFAGPGAFTLTILAANDNYTFTGLSGIIGAIIAVSASIVVVLRFSIPISERLGHTGLNIITRIMGIILTAFAVEMISKGLIGLFPVLAAAAVNG